MWVLWAIVIGVINPRMGDAQLVRVRVHVHVLLDHGSKGFPAVLQEN
jgi:hypothetical protein